MELHDESQDLITLADLIPVQLSDPIAVRLRMSGEFRLLWAVLEDAIECYLRRGLRRRLQEIREQHALVPLKRAA